MKVYVGSVGYSLIEVPHLMSVLALQQLGVKVHVQGKHALWEVARSLVASSFVREPDVDVLLLVEGDVSFDLEDAIVLCRQAVEYDIVAAACGESARDACWIDDEARPHELSEAPIPVRSVGSGMIAIHRRVLEALRRRSDMPTVQFSEVEAWPFFYPMFLDMQGQRVVAGDVQAFCERAREEGFGAYVNVAVKARRVAETAANSLDVFQTKSMTLADSKEVINANGRTSAPKGDASKEGRAGRAARDGDPRVGFGAALAQGKAGPVVSPRRRR